MTAKARWKERLKSLVRFGGWLLAPPVLGAIALALTNPVSVSGFGYAVAVFVAWLGVVRVGKPLGKVRALHLWAGAMLLAGIVAGVRLATAGADGSSSGRLRLQRVGRGAPPGAWAIARLVDERDLSLSAVRLFRWMGLLPWESSQGLPDAFAAAYDAMDEAEGPTPSVLVTSVVGAQSQRGFDLFAYEAEDARGTVVFLHGLGGGNTVLCWTFAQAAADAGFRTLCPNTDTGGAWWRPRGRAILEQTLDLADSEQPLVLAGLSNGARGVAEVAPSVASRLDGLILISGAASTPPPPLPALAILGAQDRMFRPGSLRHWAREAGRRAQLVSLEGGHFVFLTDPAAMAAVTEFLSRRLR